MHSRNTWVSILAAVVALSAAACGNDSANTSGSAPAASGPPPAEVVSKIPVTGLAAGSLVRGSGNVVYIWRAQELHPLVTRSSASGMRNGMQVVPNGWIDLTFLGLGPSSVMRLSDEDIEKLARGAEIEGSNPPR